MIPFNYHHLYYFYTVAEEGSVSGAAKKLRLAQPTLSAQLKQFEFFLDRKLFLREGKGLRLTDEGRQILTYAKSIFDLGRELADSLRDRPGPGRLRMQLGITGLIPKSFVDSLLRYVFKHFKNTYVTVVEKEMRELVSGLQTHQLDLVLNDLPFQAPAEEGFENYRIASVPVVLCASPRLAARVKRLPSDLERFPMILPTSQSRIYHGLQDFFLTHRIKPVIIAEIQDVELVRRLVLAGTGIAPINLFTARNAPGREKLVILGKPGLLGIEDTVYMIRRKRRQAHPIVEDILKNFRLMTA